MDQSFMCSDIDDYLEKLNSLIKTIESNLKICNRKYKDRNEILELFSNLNKLLVKENLNESKFFEDLTFMEKDFKRSHNLNETSRKKLTECKEKLKNLNTEIKSMKTMLDKASNSWVKFEESYNILESWLDEQENIGDISNIDFSNYQKYQKLHSQFNESGNFLIQISDSNACSKIKENLLHVNKLWKSYQDRFKDTVYEQYLKFYECEHSLNMVKERFAKIENLVNRNVKLNTLLKYQEEIQKSSNDLECLETNLNLISKLSQRIDLKQEKDKLNNFINEVKFNEQRMNQMKANIIEFLKKINKIIISIECVEDGLHHIENWIFEGENLVRLEPDQYNFDEILKHIEKQKKHFDDFKNHNNLIKAKIQDLQTFKHTVPQNIDINELNNKLLKLKDLMINLNAKRLKWEELFQAQQSLWRNFHSKTKQLEEWITNAQKIVTEKNDDYNFLIHKHKDFFDNINSEILNGFLKSGEKLFCIKNERDKLEIKNLMDTLEGQWKMILSHAPIRLLKIEFKRLESLLNQELVEADNELNGYFNALAENRDANKIFKKFQDKFKKSNFFNLCESYLDKMKNCVIQLAEKKIDDRSFIEDAFQYLSNQWLNLTQKIETLGNKLQSKLNVKETLDRNLTTLDSWLFEVESTSKQLFDYNLSSTSEYTRALDRIKVLLQELNPNRKLLNTILSQTEFLSKEEPQSLNETTVNFVENLSNRFEKLLSEDLENINFRQNYLQAILVISHKLELISGKIRNLSCSSARRFMAEEDDSSLHSAVEEQKSVLDQMRMYEREVDELKLEAKSLATDGHLQMPTVVYEKLNCVQETIRHNISEELERRSSLLEIRQLNDKKQNKLEVIHHNISKLEHVLNNQKLKDDSFTSFFDSHLNETLTDSTEESELGNYLKKLSKCKELIINTRALASDINGGFDLKKLDQYENEIDLLVDYYEQALGRQVTGEKRLDVLKDNLADVLKRFEVYSQLDLEITKEDDFKKSIELIDLENKKILCDIEKIEQLRFELNQFVNERACFENPVINYNFPEFLYEFKNNIDQEDSAKNSELNSRITDFDNDLKLVEDNYRNKHNEISYKLNQHSICKKQKKLDHLTNALDLQLDTLIGMSREKDEMMDEDEFDDLRKESDNILLERMSLDDSSSGPKELIIMQETTTRQIVRTVENVIKDDHRYEVYKVLPVNYQEENFEEITGDYTVDQVNLYEESVIIEPENEELRIEREIFEHEKAEFERSMLERQRHEQEVIERENLLRIEREKLELEKAQLEYKEREREELMRLEREKLEREKIELERAERQKREQLEEMLNLEREKLMFEKSMIEREKIEKERIERESLEMEIMLRAEREKLEFEKQELERQRIEKEREMMEIERMRLERLEREREEMESILKLEREKILFEKSIIEQERLEKERLDYLNAKRLEEAEKERIERETLEVERLLHAEREKLEMEKKELERQRLEKEREMIEIEKLRIERIERERIADIERQRVEKEKIELERRRVEMEKLEREREELEKQHRLEKERLEREKIERERLELERQEIERRKLEAERLERERIELERIAEKERERLERERLDLERERVEIEHRRIEKEKLERERQELEEVYKLEEERLERERLELERQRREKELLERERFELERQRIERENLEREREELERQHRIEREKIERERMQLEYLEKERLELERQEFERIKLIEKEREERLRQERIRIEKMRAEREQKEKEDRERRERERAEAEKILELKRREREDSERNEEIERQRRAEVDRIENELRREKLEKLEQERLRNQEKFKLELHLKEICEKLNCLKLRIIDFEVTDNCVEFIHRYEEEINELDDQVLNLYNKSISLENRLINPENSDYFLFDSLDQATLTQFELLRSFLAYLNTQIEHKKKEILRRADMKIKLSNLKDNLDRYVILAEKFNQNESNIYVENQLDLEKRIESMESIENSIENCFKQISELSKELKNDDLLEELSRNKLEIDTNIVQPLLMNLSRLEHFLSQWKLFDDKFSLLKIYLNDEVRFRELVELMRQESILTSSSSLSLELELDKYSSLRGLLVKKLAECDELLMLGSNLFDLGQKPAVICVAASKDFSEMRQLIGDVSKFLDEKCAVLRQAMKENKRLESIEDGLQKVEFDLNTVIDSEDTHDILVYKHKYEKLNELKKQVRFLMEEKELGESANEDVYSENKFNELSKKFNLIQSLDMDNTIKSLMDKIICLEMEYHQKIMKNLPSRNSLNNLQRWILEATNRLDQIETTIETDRPIDPKKLDTIKKGISQLKEELINEKEIELNFCVEIIENEIKQGFYDLAIQEKSSQLKSEFEKFRQKVNSTLDRIEISILKLNEFNRSIYQIKFWATNKNKQNEIENFTKFKTDFEESTILMDEMTSLTCLDDEKNMVKQIINLNQELEEIKNFWLQDKIVNDNSIRVLIYDYIISELNDLKNNLEKIEIFNQIKIENNLSQLKQTFTNEINDLNMRLQNELNFILNGKMTNLAQYLTTVENLKEILEKLDNKRNEMGRHLKKFELDIKTTEFPMVVNLSKNTGFLLDPHIKHSILNNLTNRELELKAKNVIYQAEKDLIEQWKKYEDMYKTLLDRLDITHQSLTKDLNNIDSLLNSENLLVKSNLFEQTVNDMIKNKNLFNSLEKLGEGLWCLNENLKLEVIKNKEFIEQKFEELSELADKLSHKLEKASLEQKKYLKLADNVEEMLTKFNKMMIDYATKDFSGKFSVEIKKLCSEIEVSEGEIRTKMAEFKSLNIKDSERIEKIYQLTSQCSLVLNKLRDFRVKLSDQIQERNYSNDIKLNDLESFLNTLSNFVAEKFSDTGVENALENYINSIKYLQTNDLELNKWELNLEHLEVEVDEEKHRIRIGELKEKIQKNRRMIRLLIDKDGLFEQLLKLKDLSQIVESIDFKLSNDELKLINLKEDFINIKFKIEKLINECGIINFEHFKQNCLKVIEAKINACITDFMEMNDLSKKFKILLTKIDAKIMEIDLKFTSEFTEFTQDLSAHEQKLANLKLLKSNLINEEFNKELEELEKLANKLEIGHEYQKLKIKYLNLSCDLDKSINKLDFEYDHLKQIIDKSQKLLDLIKQSHQELAKFKLNQKDEAIDLDKSVEEMLDHMKFKILGKLTENEAVKNEILDLYSKYLSKTTEKSMDLIKDIIDKLLFEWNLINEKCVSKIKKFELFKTKQTDMDGKLNKIREYAQSMENYIRCEMFINFDLTDIKQIMAKKKELENLMDCLSKKDLNTDLVFKQALSMYKTNKHQLKYVSGLKDRWSDLKILIRDKLLKLSNIWLFLNDQIENFYVILKKTEEFYSNILLNGNDLAINDVEIKNFELSKYTSFFRLVEDLYSTINEDNRLIKNLNESFINFSKYVHDFESTQCLEKIKDKLMDINSRWDALHNDIAVKIRLARKYQADIRHFTDLPFNEDLLIWINELNLLITNLEHLSTRELQLKAQEIEEIKREICDQTQLVFRSERTIIIEPSLLDRIKDLMRRIIRLDSFIQQSTLTNLTKSFSAISNRTSEFTHGDVNFSCF